MHDKTNSLLSRQDCLLLIIDMQEKLVPVIRAHELIVDNIVRLVKFAQITGLPVMVTEQEKLGQTIVSIRDEICSFHPILKIDFNAARCTVFITTLKNTGKKKLIVTGIESHICVMQTVIDLLPDYTIHVIADAVSSRTDENRAIALERMRSAGAVISSTEMVMYELLGRAGTDEFKSVLPLVKKP